MIEEKGYGKINLALAITGRRDDGYHNIDTIFQSVELCDTIQIEEAPGLELTCSDASLPCDETNLAYRAFAALAPYSRKRRGARIHIDKHIPLAAGLAGGSADGAAVLRGLNRLWQLGLTAEELCRIGASIGADVPFCLLGGTMRGRGIGDVLEPLRPLPPWKVIILHPPVPVYTGRAYALFDACPPLKTVLVDAAAAAAEARDFQGLAEAMGNTFEELVMPDVPLIGECRRLLMSHGLRPLMAGSGPTVFALVPPDGDACGVYEALTEEAEPYGADVYLSALSRGKDGQHE